MATKQKNGGRSAPAPSGGPPSFSTTLAAARKAAALREVEKAKKRKSPEGKK